MNLQTMYPARQTLVVQLTADISASAGEIAVSDGTAFPTGPNYATIGTDNNAEVILYTAVDVGNNRLTGCARGQSGTTARAWQVGAFLYHSWTAANANAIMGNIEALNADKAESSELERLAADTATALAGKAAAGDISAAVTAHNTSPTAHAAEMAKKADKDAMNTALAAKADKDAMNTALAAKADKSTTTAVTLPAAGWDGMGPYTQTVNIPGIVAGTHGQFDVANDATPDQRTQFIDAQLFDVTPEGQDAVTFLAMGDLPAGDIPLKILIVG